MKGRLNNVERDRLDRRVHQELYNDRNTPRGYHEYQFDQNRDFDRQRDLGRGDYYHIFDGRLRR